MGRDRFLFNAIKTVSERIPLAGWLRLYRSDFIVLASYEGDKRAALEELVELSRLAEGGPTAGIASSDTKLASAALICLARKAYDEHRIAEAEDLFVRSHDMKLHADPPDLKGIPYILN
jgi:hypothetical protein